MEGSRRKFLRQTVVAGAGLGILATSDVVDAQKTRLDVIPTPQATTLMGLFGLRYPIFQAPYGGIDLAAAVSNAGAMGAIALWNNTPDEELIQLARTVLAEKETPRPVYCARIRGSVNPTTPTFERIVT